MDVTPNLYRRLVFAAVFPLACPGCGALGAAVCPRCASGLRPPPAAPPPPGVDAWAAPLAYEGVAREVVARVKYRNVRAVVPWLAPQVCEALLSVDELAPAIARDEPPPVLTWAPTTPRRRRDRGFDPAELLARTIARRLDWPCRSLLWRAPGPAQTSLTADARRAGPRFTSARAQTAIARAAGTVIVVDDVATTGATLASAAATLRSAGARCVVAVTAARTPPPGYR